MYVCMQRTLVEHDVIVGQYDVIGRQYVAGDAGKGSLGVHGGMSSARLCVEMIHHLVLVTLEHLYSRHNTTITPVLPSVGSVRARPVYLLVLCYTTRQSLRCCPLLGQFAHGTSIISCFPTQHENHSSAALCWVSSSTARLSSRALLHKTTISPVLHSVGSVPVP